VTHFLILAGLILPLALDTFVLSAALGIAGIPSQLRMRTSLILSAFEAGMPVFGFFAGGAVSHFIGYFAGWTAIAFLAITGALMLRRGAEEKEQTRLRLLAHARGIAVIDLGLSISLDELAVGFSIGLLGLPLFAAVIWIGVQAFGAAQLGMRLGDRLGEVLRERVEKLAGAMLLVMAGLLVTVKLTSGLF
jgi:manganese efflux pump family protein